MFGGRLIDAANDAIPGSVYFRVKDGMRATVRIVYILLLLLPKELKIIHLN